MHAPRVHSEPEAGWLGDGGPTSGCLTGTVAERGRIHAFTAHNPPSPPRKVQWLIIGTTTGVIGTFNAAVLRFTLQQEEQTLDKEYDRWAPGFQSFFKSFKLERKGGRWKEGMCLWCGPVPRSLGPAGYQGLADKGAWREHTLAERGRDAGQAAFQPTCAAMHSLKVDAPRAAGPPFPAPRRLAGEEQAVFKQLGLPGVHHTHTFKKTLMTRLSLATSRLCATRGAVMATIILIAGLLIGATAVLWNETAQLLVNSVTVSRAAKGGRGRCSRGSAVTHHTNCAAPSLVSSEG